MTYLSARIAEGYRKTICYSKIEDPIETMKKIEQIKNRISSTTIYRAKRVWSAIVFEPKLTNETVEKFIDCFNRGYSKLYKLSSQPISEQEAVENFVMACTKNFKEVVYFKLANPQIPLCDIQNFLRQIVSETEEGELRSIENKPSTALTADEAGEKKKIKCYKCGCLGHHQSQCISATWICYNCEKMVDDHESENCPERVFEENPSYSMYPRRLAGQVPRRSSLRRRTNQFPRRASIYRGHFPRSGRKVWKRMKFVDPTNKVTYGFVSAVHHLQYGYEDDSENVDYQYGWM